MAGDIDLLTEVATNQKTILKKIEGMEKEVTALSRWKDECDAGRRLLLWILGLLGSAATFFLAAWDKVKWW